MKMKVRGDELTKIMTCSLHMMTQVILWHVAAKVDTVQARVKEHAIGITDIAETGTCLFESKNMNTDN